MPGYHPVLSTSSLIRQQTKQELIATDYALRPYYLFIVYPPDSSRYAQQTARAPQQAHR